MIETECHEFWHVDRALNSGIFGGDEAILGGVWREESRDERCVVFVRIPARWSTLEAVVGGGGAEWRGASGGVGSTVSSCRWHCVMVIRVCGS